MKKKVFSIICLILIVASIATITVFATKALRPSWVQSKMGKGFSEDDAYKIMAIVNLSDEDQSKDVEKKFKELGDWNEVAKFYNVDLKSFNDFVAMQHQVAADLQMPEKVYKEMQKDGMTDEECYRLAMHIRNAGLDIETTWNAMEKGKTLDEVIKENADLKTAQMQAATDFAFGKIDEKEYIKTMHKLDNKMTEKEIYELAEKERVSWTESRKAATGITEEEIALAQSAGITNVLQMCELKDAEKLSNLNYEEMLSEVKTGKDMKTVIKENRSETKIKALQEKHKSENK